MYATYKILKSKIIMDYTSKNGQWMGGEVIDLDRRFNGDLQSVAYARAEVRARNHGTRLESLRPV